MLLTFRPIKVWPEGWQDANRDRKREYSPFRATYSDTLEVLDRELTFLDARACGLQVAATDRDVRLDGQLRADAKVEHPGVILTIETRRHGTLVYATDRFTASYYRSAPSWQHNLRAIALGLEALRKVERYGIAERGQQYAGYRELGAGIPLGAAMSVDEAAAFLIEYGEWGGVPATVDDVATAGPDVVQAYFREAAKRLHPDAGGDAALFRRLTQARDVLLGEAS